MYTQRAPDRMENCIFCKNPFRSDCVRLAGKKRVSAHSTVGAGKLQKNLRSIKFGLFSRFSICIMLLPLLFCGKRVAEFVFIGKKATEYWSVRCVCMRWTISSKLTTNAPWVASAGPLGVGAGGIRMQIKCSKKGGRNQWFFPRPFWI